MKPTNILRIALEGDENTYPPSQEAQQTETSNNVASTDIEVNADETTEQKSTTEVQDAIVADKKDDDDDKDSQKKLKKEKEFVFYGKVANFEDLKKCKNTEYQEQYEVKIPNSDKNATGGRIRVRKTVKGDKDPKYVLTTKTKLPDGSDYESDCKTTEENFIQFKYFCEGGMIKDRYCFPVEGYKDLKWEVDVYTGTNGLLHEWVKVDLEIGDEAIELVSIPPFPIELTDVISNQNGQRTPEEEAIVRTLYDTVFRTPNPIIAEAKKD